MYRESLQRRSVHPPRVRESDVFSVLTEISRHAIPATLATLVETRGLAHFLQTHPHKSCVLVGTGMVDQDGVFHPIVIDFSRPDADGGYSSLSAEPVLGVMDSGFTWIRDNCYSVALFTGPRVIEQKRRRA